MTMQLFVKIGSSYIAVSNFVLILIYIISICSGKVHLSRRKIILIILEAIFILSYVININYLETESWRSFSKSAVIKLAVYLLPYIFLVGCESYENFISGLKLGTFIQLLWGVAQLVLYKFAGITLNQIVFANTVLNRTTVMTEGNVRLTGISGEPANFGLEFCMLLC
jgi:hypothetical protein